MGKVNLTGAKNMEEMVITPGGLRPKSQVHLIENGFYVNRNKDLLEKCKTDTHTVVQELGKINKGIFENFTNRNLLRESVTNLLDFEDNSQPPITDKWIIYSSWTNNSGVPITFFSTNWVVPPPPETDNGQLIYIFNGIENSAFNVILQPVLQWGSSPAGGGSFWAIANWFVGAPHTGIALHGPLIRVNPGDNLQGIMALRTQFETQFNYVSSFKGFPSADLFIDNIDELVWANETLECYGLAQFSDYPNTLMTHMKNIEIRVGNSQASLLWEAHNDVTDNGQHCSIISNASPGGSVALNYRQQLA